MPTQVLKDFLDKHGIAYTSISHSPGYTAQEVAAVAHVSGKQFAKTVIVKMKNQFAMVIVPAHENVNFSALKNMTGIEADLAKEYEFKSRFPECEMGAMPPFGNLYNLPVYVSSHLGDYDLIAFNAGTHSELLKLAYRDFERLVNPKVVNMH